MVNIAILGAGLCGLVVAHKLKPYANITIFEKARGMGGRMSTKRAEPLMEFIPKSFKHYSYLASKHMMRCFSLMLGFHKALSLDFDAALVNDADISWISVNSSKPGRMSAFSLVIHSTNKWAEEHLDDNSEKVMHYLCRETSRIVGNNVEIADHKAIHRWRYANIEKQSTQHILIDVEQKLAICGDWCVQGRVEAAFVTGLNIANHLLDIIN